MIATDGCPGLHAAMDTVYPYIPRQRCWAHKLRNVANNIRRKDQEECLTAAKKIYLAKNRGSESLQKLERALGKGLFKSDQMPGTGPG